MSEGKYYILRHLTVLQYTDCIVSWERKKPSYQRYLYQQLLRLQQPSGTARTLITDFAASI